MKPTNDFMKTRPVFGLLMSMSVPMMISMLIQSLYNIVDSIYIAKLGTQALTAVSLGMPEKRQSVPEFPVSQCKCCLQCCTGTESA